MKAAVAGLAAAALLFVPAAVAGKAVGSCDVTPSSVTAGQQFTITASANVLFDFVLIDPAGAGHVWPSSPPATVTYQFATDQIGGWRVEVNALQGRNGTIKHVIATCPFTVTA